MKLILRKPQAIKKTLFGELAKVDLISDITVNYPYFSPFKVAVCSRMNYKGWCGVAMANSCTFLAAKSTKTQSLTISTKRTAQDL
jgi:hypothetical protein